MNNRRKVVLPCTCATVHTIPDPGATTYLRCETTGHVLTYECECSEGHVLRANSNNEYKLTGDEILVGRKSQLTIDHPVLSRNHCRFVRDQKSGEYYIYDLGSRNGTWVNEKQITAEDGGILLHGGDMVRLVDLNFRYLSPEGSGYPPCPLLFDDLQGTGLVFPDLKTDGDDKLIGRLLGDYRILAIISQGGMGRVYRAEKEANGTPCVVKTILPNSGGTSSNELLQRFLLEMELSLHLRHPNIITYFDIGQVGKSLYIAMEYFPGRDLKDWFEHTPATYEQVVNIGKQAALGLAYAHNQGVVHRDIKPENILYNFKGQVKIIDFGVAKGDDEPSNDSGITVTGAFVGTLRYISPEQLVKNGEVDHKCDIYSLGSTLYYCLAGRAPFDKTNALAKLRRQMEKGAPPLSKFCRGVPKSLSDVIERALNIDPAERFETAEEMAEAFDRVKL